MAIHFYKGHLTGDYLDDALCDRLLKIQQLSEEGVSFEALRHIIYDLTPEHIAQVMQTKEPISPETLAPEETGTLTSLQTVGVAYMYLAKRLLLADSVGFGKTPQVAGLIRYMQELSPDKQPPRFLYCTKASLIDKDHSELIRFTNLPVQLLHGTTSKLKKELAKNPDSSYVAPHSIIKNATFQEWLLLHPDVFDIIVIDESGAVGTAGTTDFTKPAQRICSMSDRVILLNATPFECRLDSFWSQLNLVDPTLLPSRTEFRRMFQQQEFDGYSWHFVEKYKNPAEFKEAIQLRFLSRKRITTGGTMTNCSAELITLGKSAIQKKLDALTTQHQLVYDCPSLIDKDIDTDVSTTPKLAKTLELVQSHPDEPRILIYCPYIEAQAAIQQTLQQYGYNTLILNGQTKQDDRLAITQQFTNNEKQILITNVMEGMNLGNCHMLIYYTLCPSASKIVQVEGRITREQNIQDKHVYVLATKGREISYIHKTIANRARAMQEFQGRDFSMVLDLLEQAGV